MRCGWLSVLIGWACFALFFLPRPVWAAKEHGHAGGEAKKEEAKKELEALLKKYHEACEAGHSEEAGELASKALALDPTCFAEEPPPKLPFGPWALDLTLWTIVVFLLLLYVLSKYAWKPLLEGLDARERNIRASAEDAQRARDEAQRLRDQLQAEFARAHDKVREMLDEARKEAQGLKEDMVGDARKEIQAERERLHREVSIARDEALQQIYHQGAQLAALISNKTIRRQLTPEDHRGLVDEALADLRRAVQQRRHTA
jgi:F-type H+-transporting ATPase subunit b